MTKSVLIVEDEKHLRDGLRYNLKAEGFEVETARTAEEALALLMDDLKPFDVVVLDVMLPGMDGFSLASRLRSQGQFVPILMLTARGSAGDVLRGFESGADDYLPKPFDLSILVARINGLLRRRRWNEPGPAPADSGSRDSGKDVYTFAARTIDFGAMEVRVRDRVYRLTVMECDLLRYLIARAGHPVARSAILKEVWGLSQEADTRAIDNFIVRLRRYVEERPATPKFLQTVRGVGYRFVPEP